MTKKKTVKKKPAKKKTNKGGRPKKDISPAQVKKLAEIGCTIVEIAAVVGCNPDTLYSRFSETIEKGKESMKMSLRRMQYESASKGNVTMQIWLGKQYLGQRDKQEHTGADGGPIQYQEAKESLIKRLVG